MRFQLSCRPLGLIVSLQIRIATSICVNICLSYTCLLTVFQTAAILKRGEKLSQNFTLISPLLSHKHFVTISNHLRFQFQLKILTFSRTSINFLLYWHVNYETYTISLPVNASSFTKHHY